MKQSPSIPSAFSPPELESLLDDAIDSAARTGAAIDRLSQTVQAFHDWTSGQLGRTQGDV